jgi:hypothetical protein
MFESPSTSDRPRSPLDEIVKPIQPYQARKEYACPGCEGVIAAGVGHLVVVPTDAPDLRRHWHRGCWYKELRRRGLPSADIS